jgi:DNA-binding HxlR family transcriptional regulator
MTNELKYLKKEEMDKLFDDTIRPFWSKNARTIFKVLLDSDKSHMTTLDIQDQIKKFDLNLSKKEINNWLTSLQEAKFVTKEDERGKPTTMEYNGRYTFDLWKATKYGQEITKKVVIFIDKFPYVFDLENSEKSNIPNFTNLNKVDIGIIHTYYIVFKVLTYLFKTKKKCANSYQISKEISVINEVLLEEIEKFNTYSIEQLFEVKVPIVGNLEKILQIIGFRPNKTLDINLTYEGMNLAEKLI